MSRTNLASVDHLFHISARETVLGGKALVIDLLKFLKMILNALVIFRLLGLSRSVNGGDVGHVRFSLGS